MWQKWQDDIFVVIAVKYNNLKQKFYLQKNCAFNVLNLSLKHDEELFFS